jgi:murein DD-endopeptidase MepM/ murein hydrolase activator NlpD
MMRPTSAALSSAFGWRRIDGRDDYHSGNDYAAPYGSPTYASADGEVIFVGPMNRYGLTVVLRHNASPAPLFTLHGHLSRSLVQEGEIVSQGQEIAKTGDSAGTREDPTARVRRAHLHHELLTRWPPRGIDLDRIDPQPYFTTTPVAAPTRHAPSTAVGVSSSALLLAAALYWYTQKKAPARRGDDGRR